MSLQRLNTMQKINYDKVAEGYNERYEIAYKKNGISSKLIDLVLSTNAGKVLEVGCGTGHWLEVLHQYADVVGVDLSFGMLHKAAKSLGIKTLIRADAGDLPFPDNYFDMVFCVNAVHHFIDPFTFILECKRVLNLSGVVVIIGMNPHSKKDRWYIYDYFPGTYEVDLKRYPSPRQIESWLKKAGFSKTSHTIGERLMEDRNASNILPLSKDFTSQLSLLSHEDFKRGIDKLKAAKLDAEKTRKNIVFPVDISLSMVMGNVSNVKK